MINAESFYKKYLDIDSPHEYQVSIWDRILAMKFPLLVKAPTGSGKTEAVIAPFLSQFIENGFRIAPRLIYVLPMRVLVNSVANRIKRYTLKISPYISVEIQHGDVPNAPFFIADIVVTTLDQFLYGFARVSGQVGKHLDIPAGSIASSLVVFDEAHMYRDGFTFSIMRALMEILHKSRIPYVLMTATMPQSLENSLFENIKLPENQRLIGNVSIESDLKISFEGNPLYSNGEVNISEGLLEKMKKRKTLVVVNQVKRAQKIYEDIKRMLDLDDNQIVLLHSRFTKIDRKEHEEKAISLIPHKEQGKIAIPKGIGIVISTQVLEAGIDFSAELLLTELAPADSLIQRAGRCARYEGESGEMIIFPVEDDKGHLPYEREYLLKALEWLKANKQFNFKNFGEICSFVDDRLDYEANDYEARDTLIDLYECVLYADEKPNNIQLRDGKPITLVLVDLSMGEGRKKEDKIRDAIKKKNIRDNFINIDFTVGWMLLKNGILNIRLDYNSEKGEWDFRKVREISPFSFYLLEKDNYDHFKGVIPDVASLII
jgi:CRISPR-associated endonuclease/helicase Cas3